MNSENIFDKRLIKLYSLTRSIEGSKVEEMERKLDIVVPVEEEKRRYDYHLDEPTSPISFDRGYSSLSEQKMRLEQIIRVQKVF